ncbi:hypothetical protein GCM10012286_38040 [Streptomyces lasiicapitis]|uniref:Uncharacterized protein n=1 Tax=Streptomyces lasiicapitis TaxID=1923961 RepID=A0ABQ2M443_9ACTN|nr:hypothetical protein GCM10012286_38040 [Streptomyces lasiicapitis]
MASIAYAVTFALACAFVDIAPPKVRNPYCVTPTHYCVRVTQNYDGRQAKAEEARK